MATRVERLPAEFVRETAELQQDAETRIMMHRHGGRLLLGAESPCLSWTRSPASTEERESRDSTQPCSHGLTNGGTVGQGRSDRRPRGLERLVPRAGRADDLHRRVLVNHPSSRSLPSSGISSGVVRVSSRPRRPAIPRRNRSSVSSTGGATSSVTSPRPSASLRLTRRGPARRAVTWRTSRSARSRHSPPKRH